MRKFSKNNTAPSNNNTAPSMNQTTTKALGTLRRRVEATRLDDKNPAEAALKRSAAMDARERMLTSSLEAETEA